MRSCTLPPALKPGDLLYAIAPSGAVRDLATFEVGLTEWRSRGYEVKLAPGWDDRYGYLAGTDEGRRNQLAIALQDPQCKGILCIRGGWGGARLLENWQMPIDLAHPKWLIGFSDITSLLWAFAQQGISGVHGPVLTTLEDEPARSKQRLFDWVERGTIEPLMGKGWGHGRASGLLLPANLTVATHLLQTAYQPDLSGVVLALEDVGEAPYRLDRMLTHWRMMGAFEKISGIALGRFSSCEPPEGYPSLSVEEMLRDRLADLGIPIVSGLAFGHEGENAVLPVGREVTIDGDAGRLDFR
jgi:muramoyltetrapeptide carboxypeptidase